MFYTNVIPLGNFIAFRGIGDNGESFKKKIRYLPTLFVPSKKDSKWRTLDDKTVSPVKWGSMKETRQAIKDYVGNVYGMEKFQYSFITECFPEPIDYDFSKIKIATIDIETSSENGFPDTRTATEEVLTISYKYGDTFFVYGCGEYLAPENVKYLRCSNEKELLQNFITDWSKKYPDIITGWNTQFFDIPYLVNRIIKVLGEKQANNLSPWGWIKEMKIYTLGREQQTYDLVGISSIDYLDLYKKFTYVTQESYTLNHIAYAELGEKKLDYSEYATLHELYKTNYQKFVDYNVQDVVLVDRLEERMKLLEMVISLAYMSKCNYNDVFAQTRMWDCIMYNHLHKKNIVIPPKASEHNVESYVGAYVKEAKGRYNWIASFDINSLYPMLICQYNISPETFLGILDEHPTFGRESMVEPMLNKEVDTKFLKEKNITMTPNGAMYSMKKQGFLPALMEEMYNDRVKYKDLLLQEQKKGKEADKNKLSQYYNLQINLKIALNSAYGSFGNKWFRFYSSENAEAVTTAGQLAIRWSEKIVNDFMNKLVGTEEANYVVASDTDSLYVVMDELIKKVGLVNKPKETIIKFMDNICEGKFQEIIDNGYKDLAEYTNAFEQKMVMKREVLADVGIWTGKKHYILNVFNSEGVQYDEPKLKIMGIEAIKSSTPQPVREALKEAFKIIVTGTEEDVLSYIEEFKKKFKTLPVEDIASPRSVKGLKKYYDPVTIYRKATPMHVKASLIYNYLLSSQGLTKKYPRIMEGEKIKYVYLKEPNCSGDRCIAMLNTFPKEFNLNNYIDYDTQFEKTFLSPMRGILEAIKWKTERISTLDNFFN